MSEVAAAPHLTGKLAKKARRGFRSLEARARRAQKSEKHIAVNDRAEAFKRQQREERFGLEPTPPAEPPTEEHYEKQANADRPPLPRRNPLPRRRKYKPERPRGRSPRSRSRSIVAVYDDDGRDSRSRSRDRKAVSLRPNPEVRTRRVAKTVTEAADRVTKVAESLRTEFRSSTHRESQLLLATPPPKAKGKAKKSKEAASSSAAPRGTDWAATDSSRARKSPFEVDLEPDSEQDERSDIALEAPASPVSSIDRGYENRPSAEFTSRSASRTDDSEEDERQIQYLEALDRQQKVVRLRLLQQASLVDRRYQQRKAQRQVSEKDAAHRQRIHEIAKRCIEESAQAQEDAIVDRGDGRRSGDRYADTRETSGVQRKSGRLASMGLSISKLRLLDKRPYSRSAGRMRGESRKK